MEKNVIVQTIEEVVGTDKIEYISGIVENIGTEECSISPGRGSVYGVAVLIKDDSDKEAIYNQVPIIQRAITIDKWKQLKDNYYPLYWGKDINMGARLQSHTKTMQTTGTIQMNNLKCLIGHKAVYGAIPCANYEENERKLIKSYACLLKTTRGKTDGVKVNDLSPDESH